MHTVFASLTNLSECCQLIGAISTVLGGQLLKLKDLVRVLSLLSSLNINSFVLCKIDYVIYTYIGKLKLLHMTLLRRYVGNIWNKVKKNQFSLLFKYFDRICPIKLLKHDRKKHHFITCIANKLLKLSIPQTGWRFYNQPTKPFVGSLSR